MEAVHAQSNEAHPEVVSPARVAAMEKRGDALVILRRQSVEAKTGLPRSTLYRLIAAGDFPKPITLAEGKRQQASLVGWIEAEVDAWIKGRIARSRIAA